MVSIPNLVLVQNLNIEGLDKLGKVISDHLSSRSNPALVVEMAKAKLQVRLLKAQASHDAKRISRGELRITSESNVLTSPSNLIPAGQLTNEQRLLESDLHRKAKADENIQKIVAYAVEETILNKGEDKGEVDDDLISRFFNEAQFIHKEDIQKLWGRFLANAVSAPNSCSVELLDFMRKMTNKKAQDIALMAPYVFADRVIVITPKILKVFSSGIGYWLQMENLGVLLNGNSPVTRQFPSLLKDRYSFVTIFGSKVLIIEHDNPENKVKFKVYGLSDLGLQVLGLGTFGYDEEYLNEVAANAKSQGFRVQIGDFVKYEGNRVMYANIGEL